jgi:hypothetical protein
VLGQSVDDSLCEDELVEEEAWRAVRTVNQEDLQHEMVLEQREIPWLAGAGAIAVDAFERSPSSLP